MTLVFEMFRGDDKVYQIVVTNKLSGLPVDITGCTLVLTLRETYTSDIFIQRTFSLTDPTHGVAEVTIPAASTSGLTDERHEFVFDVQITKTDLTVETLCNGTFVVQPDVTYS